MTRDIELIRWCNEVKKNYEDLKMEWEDYIQSGKLLSEKEYKIYRKMKKAEKKKDILPHLWSALYMCRNNPFRNISLLP